MDEKGEEVVDMEGSPLMRTGSVCPFQFICRTMRERGSEVDIQPPRARFLGGML